MIPIAFDRRTAVLEPRQETLRPCVGADYSRGQLRGVLALFADRMRSMNEDAFLRVERPAAIPELQVRLFDPVDRE